MSRGNNRFNALLCVSLLWLSMPAMADIDRLAALLIRFSQYTELTNSPDRKQICVLQDQRIVLPLNRILPDFHQFEPEAILLQSTVNAAQCHIIWSGFPFWPSEEWLQFLNNQPLLWISDHPDLFRRGVIISVHYTPQAMRFRVNQTQASKHQIRFNSRLLQLAHEII